MKQRATKKQPSLRTRLIELAHAFGAQEVIEPEWGVAGNLTFPSGSRAYFLYSSLLINGTSEIVRDKDFTQFFLRSMGHPTVRESQTFFTNAWAEAYGSKQRLLKHAHAYAQKIGYPVFVKPNKGSQGRHVALAHNRTELEAALREIFSLDHIALVQKPVPGTDYRVVVYRGKVVCAYARHPLSLCGDGTHSIATLLAAHIETHHLHLKLNDPRITRELSRNGLTRKSILKKGETLPLLHNANLSTGGSAVNVSTTLHPFYKKLACAVARDFRLTLAGIDLLVDGDHTKKPTPGSYVILEVNSSPGLDHFASLGSTEQKIVTEHYKRMLTDLAR